jgi:MFS family permease
MLLGAAGLLAFAAATSGWQVLAVWWCVLGPAAALTFYEPAYIAIQQAFAPEARARAIATLTLTAGLSGPVSTVVVGALVEGVGWRDATRVLAAAMACATPLALAFLPAARPDPARREPRPRKRLGLRPFRSRRMALFTAGAILAYGAIEAVIVHRVARWEELGFSLATVTVWAGVSGLVTLPGRFVLPVLARRVHPTAVLVAVLAVLTLATGLMIDGTAYWQMATSFVLFGLVFGAALPLRAIVMGDWTATAIFGEVMGVQAAMIAVGRAGVPALAGALHDLLGGYAAAMAVLTVMLAVATVLTLRSGRV